MESTKRKVDTTVTESLGLQGTGKQPRFVHFADKTEENQQESVTNAPSESVDPLHFFTKIWNPPAPIKESIGVQTDEVDEHTVTKEERKLASKPASAKSDLLTVYLSPFYQKYSDRIKNENQTLYFPSLNAPLIGNYIESPGPVFKEDEGLYAGKRPFVATFNQNLMEQRIITEKAFHWIDQDWRLKALPDPVNVQGTRCPIEHDREGGSSLVVDGFPVLTDRSLLHRNRKQRLEMAVELINVEFSHHYLFSLEHVLASILQQQYQNYQALVEERVTTYLTERINGLKKHLQSLQKQIAHGVRSDLKEKIIVCVKDILFARIKRDEEYKREQVALNDLVEAWTRLKLNREKKGFTNSCLHLSLGSHRSSKEADMDVYQRDIEEELSEREVYFILNSEDRQIEYINELTHWEDLHDNWEKARLTVDKATEQQKMAPQADIHLARTPEPERPKPQATFNGQEELWMIEDRLVHSRRRPGDPILVPELRRSVVVSENSACSAAERARRVEVAKQRISARIVINGKDVCKIESCLLSEEFVVKLGRSLSIIVEYIPNAITVELYEASAFAESKIAEIFVPVPDEKVITTTAANAIFEFSNPNHVPAQNEAVGSGVSAAGGRRTYQRFTTGTLRCRFAWTPETAKFIAASTRAADGLVDPLQALGAQGIRDVKKLAEWTNKAQIDPNDPTFAELIYFVKNMDSAKDVKYFRLEELQQEFDFASASDIASSNRFQLIQLREKQVPEFADLKMIPANESEISDRIIINYTKQKSQEANALLGGGDAQRISYSRMLQQLREYISNTIRSAETLMTYDDVVIEDHIFSFGNFFAMLSELWRPKQLLKPVRKRRKTVSIQQLSNTEMHLVVRISRAVNLPFRLQSAPPVKRNAPHRDSAVTTQLLTVSPAWTSNSSDSPSVSANMIPKGPNPGPSGMQPVRQPGHTGHIRAFAIARFGGKDGRIRMVDGQNPVWNEQIKFRLNPTSKSNTQFLKQELEIHFYDEVAVDVLEDNLLRESHVFQRLDRRWLGSLSFSFSGLYLTSKIEGTFPLRTPPVILGYNQTSIRGQGGVSAEAVIPQATVFVTLDPPLTPPQPLSLSQLESLENDEIVNTTEEWASSLRKQFPDRLVKPFVVNTSAQSCLIIRFVRPLNAPPGLFAESAAMMEKMTILARFVSLIPMVSDTLLFPDAVDIWTSNDQFLNLRCGDDEEHALLLLSYFLYLKVPAFLLIGQSVSSGPGAFVLSKPTPASDFLIWDATIGKHYLVTNANCPVNSVGMIADATNIWANAQARAVPHEMQWQLKNIAHWKPLWTVKQPQPQGIHSLQPEVFEYSEVPAHVKHELEVLLKNKIIVRIMQDRSRHVTRWNIDCNRQLHVLLDTIEVDLYKPDIRERHERELKDLMLLYNIYGFPLNVAYTSADELVDAVIATGVHQVRSDNVEFSLAVNALTYPHSVVSVWIYIAVLTKKG